MVRPNAEVRVAGDAILIEHEYPTWSEYRPVGRIGRFYEKDGALLIEFSIHSEEALNRMREGDLGYLSVSWFGDRYSIEDTANGPVIAFDEIVIYEVSLVSAPAFNTCFATEEGGLSCLSPSVHAKCKCGGKCGGNSVSLGDMIARHQEVTRDEFTALADEVRQLREALAVITQEVAQIKEMIAQPATEVVAELEQAKKRLDDVELVVSTQAQNLEGLVASLGRLISITEKTYRNIPNLIRQ